MAVKQTKKLSGQQTTSTVATGEKIAKVDANGAVTLIDLAHLKTALLSGIDLNAMMDGVFIMYHKKNNDFPAMVKPQEWPPLQINGEIADGVVIVEGGKVLVIAPTECDSAGLLWSSAAVAGGSTMTSDRVAAINDWDGKNNTASIISKSTSATVTNTSAYAPGFSNLYSRANANGKGLTAGKWWLPSVGEMLMIYAYKTKINYALSLISGATQLANTWYWTSTEGNSSNAWHVYLSDGVINYVSLKNSYKGRVRPVSAFIS